MIKIEQKIFHRIITIFLLAAFIPVLTACTSSEEIPVDCEDEASASCSQETTEFEKGKMGTGQAAAIAGGAVLLAGAANSNGSNDDNKSSSSGSSGKSLVSIDKKVMRLDANDEGQVLLVESSNIQGSYAPGAAVNGIINWQFSDNEDTDTLYLGGIFGDWDGGTFIANIDAGFPVIGETHTETFSFTAPETPGIYLLKMILNSSTSYPESWGDFQHYQYSFIFEVSGHDDVSPDSSTWYIGRGDPARIEQNIDVGGHVVALENENISGKTFGRSEEVTANFTWGFPYGENRNAIFSCNAIGSWDQQTSISDFYSGDTLPKGVSETTSFNFTTPSTNGVYALRLFFSSTFDFAPSFTGNTHYFADLVFSVTNTSLPLEGLQLHYPFNGNTNDESGNDRHSEVFLSPTLTADRNGSAESAYLFIAGEHPNIGNIYFFEEDLLGGKEAFSISAWFNASDIPSESSVITSAWDVFGQMLLGPNTQVDNKISFRVNIGGGSFTNIEVLSDEAVTLGQWYHVVVTYDGSEVKMYVNDQLQQDVEKASGNVATHEVHKGFRIGMEGRNAGNVNSPEGYTGFDGTIDDIRIYSVALSLADVEALYGE
ncbi:MAG: hypothetical protein HQM14_08275 [SAR324 cluster bacterium]|nr:hypothetical protein [SAR324 cluster bacterium]